MDHRIPSHPRWSLLSLLLIFATKSFNTNVTKFLDPTLILTVINKEIFFEVFFGYIIVDIQHITTLLYVFSYKQFHKIQIKTLFSRKKIFFKLKVERK